MKLLVVEDDKALAQEVADFLRAAGSTVDVCHSGDDALHLALTAAYDVMVLDLGLPGKDGINVLASIRAVNPHMPVLILTARDRFADKAQAFRAGADDYVTKPFRIEEVLLRIRALIRRAGGSASIVLQVGALSLDTMTEAISFNALPMRLTHLEGRLLSHLIRRAGAVVSRTELSEHLYELDQDQNFNTIEVIVSRLRKKIGRDAIETIRGGGYRLRVDETNDALS